MEYVTSDRDAGTSLKEVLLDLKKGNMSSCYLLFGEEDFLIKDALDKIISLSLPESDRDLNLFYMDGEHIDLDGLCQSLLMPPLISGRKVVVLRNTRIFHSAKVLPEVTRSIREHINDDPDRAAKDFMHFLQMTGWGLDDLKDGRWNRIGNDEWQKAVGDDSGREREAWLPRMIEICINRGLKEGKVAEEADHLTAILKSGLPEGNHLILTANTVDKRKKLFRIISETGRVLYFPQVKIETRKRQILMDKSRDILTKAGKTMSPGAWTVIGRKTGFEVANSVEAIEKLVTYVGEKLIIEEADVEEVIGKTKEDTIFDLTDALSEKNLNRGLAALKDLFEQGINELQILSMVAREIRFLLQAGLLISSGKLTSFDSKMDYRRFQNTVYPVIQAWAGGAGKKESGGEFLRQHPYVMYNALKNAHRFTFDVMVGYLDDLVDMDIAFKSTARDPKFALERFLMKVCS